MRKIKNKYIRSFVFLSALMILGSARAATVDISKLSDDELIQRWKSSLSGNDFEARREFLRRGKDEKIVSGLLSACQETSGENEFHSVILLQQLGAKETAPQLLEIFEKDNRAGMKGEIAITLASFGYQPAVRKIAQALGELNESGSKVQVIIALQWLGDSSAIPAIKKELNQPVDFPRADYARSQAAYSLAIFGDDGGRETAESILAEKTVPGESKGLAIEALGIIGDKKDFDLNQFANIKNEPPKNQERDKQLFRDYFKVGVYLKTTKGLTDDQKDMELAKLLDLANWNVFQWALNEVGRKPSTSCLKKLEDILRQHSQPQDIYLRSMILDVLHKYGMNRDDSFGSEFMKLIKQYGTD